MADIQSLLTSSPGTKNLNYPTDYNLVYLTLATSLSGTPVVDLMPLLLEFNVYEDIYSSTMSGEVVISDSLGIASKYFLNGSEFLYVKFSKTSQSTHYFTGCFRIYKMGKRVVSDSNTSEVYSLKFCSEEFILSEQYRLSKSYKGKMISDIVTDVLKTYIGVGGKNTKQFFVQSTSGVYDFILPNKKLFESINWLSNYAIPADSQIPGDVVFYENQFGYFFTSLRTLFSTQVYNQYSYDPKNILTKDMNQMLVNVSDFEVLNYFDVLGGITNGTFTNKLITFDPLLRTVNTSNVAFNYAQYFNNSAVTKLNSGPITTNYKNRFGASMYDPAPAKIGLETACLRMAASNFQEKKNSYVAQAPDSVANDISVEKYIPNRAGQLSLVNYLRIKVSIPGDPAISVGRVIHFSMFTMDPSSVYSNGGDNKNRPTDPMYTGNYIVTAVRHIINPSTYITVLELCKESNSTQLPGFDSSNPIIQSSVNGVVPT